MAITRHNVNLNIRVSQQLQDMLTVVAEQLNVNKAEFVRQAIVEKLEDVYDEELNIDITSWDR